MALVMPASGAREITLRYPLPRDCDLSTVCWTGAQFVAAGGNGAILTSADGAVWVPRSAGVFNAWATSSTGNGRIILAGEESTTATSTDGIFWTVSRTPVGGPDCLVGHSLNLSLFHSNKFFVSNGSFRDANCISAASYCSGDGATWTPNATPPGISSRARAVTGTPSVIAQLVGNGNPKFVLGDPSGWTVNSTNLQAEVTCMVWTGTRFIAGATGGGIHTSLDGMTWTARTSGVMETINGMVSAAGLIVAVGDGGTILSSSSGTTWTSQTSNSIRNLNGITWSGSKFVAVGQGGVILHSIDGVVWSVAYAGNDPTAINSAGWTGSHGLAVGTGGTLMTSDGISWTKTSSSSPGYYPRILELASNQNIILASVGNALYTSPVNGSGWTQVSMGAESAVWDGQRFVVLANYKVFAPFGQCSYPASFPTSPDGIQWSGILGSACGATVGARTIAFTGDRYVIPGASSRDLVNWTPSNISSQFQLFWTGSKLIGVEASGEIHESLDGLVWTKLATPKPNFGVAKVIWTGSHLVGFPNRSDVSSFSGNGIVYAMPGSPWNVVPLPLRFKDSVACTGTRLIIAAGGLLGAGALFTIDDYLSDAVPLSWVFWKSTYFLGSNDSTLIGPKADPDGDGVPNLVEYATGTIPSNNSSRMDVVKTIGDGAAGVTFEWTRLTSRTDVFLTPQISVNLIDWDDVSSTTTGMSGDTASMKYTSHATGLLFFRLSARLLP